MWYLISLMTYNNVGAATNLVTAVNQIAESLSQVTGIKGDTGDPGIYKSSTAPVERTLGMYWDELTSDGFPSSQLYWNGLYWIERSPRFINFSGASGVPTAVPWGLTSNIILFEKFTTVTTGGELNNENNFYEYRLMNGNSANASLGIIIASNFSKSPSGRREYSVDINAVYTTKPTSLAVWGFKTGTTNENLAYSGHTIRFRLGRS
ncbi:hypothetical protein NIES4074_36170 [Cylindrospermum sp. NIES-4074]|nr:hypothetical protein NIES4074_36170 [Cylindrospermum sp. NIES-4074]